MRRHVLAVLVVTFASLAAFAAPAAQSQDAVVTSARSLAQQGHHDSAITMLRDAIAARPSDAVVRGALIEMLEAERARLQQQMQAMGTEIAALRADALSRAGEGCDSQTPIEVGKAIRAPMKLGDVKPVYPKEALEAGIGGTVVMEVTISCSGDVIEALVVRGVPALDAAALGAVKGWRYRPTLMNGAPVPVKLHVTITFTPNG